MPYRHFVVKYYDNEMEKKFNVICDKLFDGKYLCVKEYKPKEHYHFQGMTSLSDSQFTKIQQEDICQQHRMRQERPNCRLCVNSNKEVNEKGFQYMCKQSNSMVICSTLDPEEIKALGEASDEHVKKLKNELNEYVHPLIKDAVKACSTKDKLKALIIATRIHIGEFAFRNGKNIRTSQMKDRAVNCILYHKHCRSYMRHWLYTI